MINHVRTRRSMAVLAIAGVAVSLGVWSLLDPVALKADAPVPTVAIDNFTFGPAALTVPVGATVVWTNRDDIPHTVTSAATPLAFRSKPLDTGDTFQTTFDKAGTYGYFCSLHPNMQGTVVVK